ncbi:homoserine kinase [Actinomyces minihominis]|uniref:homoserine kinase n=1 Tax=Actinomyces minihominis TaxID=2002838 RepID=UPI000C07406F|nr:homoserine kinase [Actinomyces minihominis]
MVEVLPLGRSATVLTPATTANLGPGFDALGLALNWVDQASVRVIERGFELTLTGVGSGSLPLDETHLVVSTILRGLENLGVKAGGLAFTAHNTIPLARGLGSSSAAIASGLALAWGLARPHQPLDRYWAFTLAVGLEGHPDNVGPAIYGGLTIGWFTDGVWKVVGAPVHDDLRVCALVPDTVLETTTARSVMPREIPLSDAIANSAHTALLVHAFSEEPRFLFDATSDRLHQEYRRALYPSSMALVDVLRDQGLAACISGAGPTVVLLHTEGQGALVDLILDGLLSGDSDLSAFKRYALGVGEGVQVLPPSQ